jgi:hypothetical protein
MRKTELELAHLAWFAFLSKIPILHPLPPMEVHLRSPILPSAYCKGKPHNLTETRRSAAELQAQHVSPAEPPAKVT